MIGWENNQGAYFIGILKKAVNAVAETVSSIQDSIGKLTDLTTTAKTSLVASVNEVDGDIGNLSSLTTTAKTNVVSAINELDSDIGNLSIPSIPSAPSASGTYVLVVADGVATWTAQTQDNQGES